MSKKPIIVFEGIEGSGKSHHISIVSKYLSKKKINHIKIREPGGNPKSEKIRKLILNNKSNFNKDTDLLLYMAARSENINIIKKSYNKKIILIDRFTDSTIAYQHYGMGVDLNLIETLNKLELLLEFMEIGGEGIKYRGGSVEIDTKYLATLSGKKWCVIGKNWWYPYGNPTDLLHKLRGSADA